MVVLDTDVIIDFLRGDKKTKEKINKLSKEGELLKTTSINTFELFKGAFRSNQSNARDELAGLLANLKVLDFGYEESEETGRVFEYLRAKGNNIDILDLMIASVAITNNEVLVTRNTNHFKRISGLELADFLK